MNELVELMQRHEEAGGQSREFGIQRFTNGKYRCYLVTESKALKGEFADTPREAIELMIEAVPDGV